MGSGSWSATTYHDRVTARAKTGKDVFDYSSDVIRSGQLRPHQTLEPYGLRRIMLATADAHGVYAKLGFEPLAQPDIWMALVFE